MNLKQEGTPATWLTDVQLAKYYKSLTAEVGSFSIASIDAAAARIRPSPTAGDDPISKSFSGAGPPRSRVDYNRRGARNRGENRAGRSTLMKIRGRCAHRLRGQIAFSASLRVASPRSGRPRHLVIPPGICRSSIRCRRRQHVPRRELTRSATARQWTDRGRRTAEGRSSASSSTSTSTLATRRGLFAVRQESHRDRQGARLQRADLLMDDHERAQRPEVDKLFALVRQLKARLRIIYITHRMEEDLRDRRPDHRAARREAVGTLGRGPPEAELIRWMIGRELSRQFPVRRSAIGAVRLEVNALSVPSWSASTKGDRCWSGVPSPFAPRDRRLRLQAPAITELLRGIFGAYGRLQQGSLDRRRAIRDPVPRRSVQQGVAYLTSDRRHRLILGLDVAQTSPRVGRVVSRSLDAAFHEWQIAKRHVRALGSGGDARQKSPCFRRNQQKVAWRSGSRPVQISCSTSPPSVDVGSKHEIYELMTQWTKDASHLMITSEMPDPRPRIESW